MTTSVPHPNRHTPFHLAHDWTNVVNPMTIEEAREWIAALRRGYYRQGRSSLRPSHETRCCLGVELDTHPAQCESVDAASMLAGNNEFVRLPRSLQDDLVRRNDALGQTFDEIADYLELGFGLISPPMETLLSSTTLSIVTRSYLADMGIYKVQDLCSRTQREILRGPNMGRKSLNYINEWLRVSGLPELEP